MCWIDKRGPRFLRSNLGDTCTLAEREGVRAACKEQSLHLPGPAVAGLGGTDITFVVSNSTIGSFSVEYTTNLADWQYLGPAIPRFLGVDTDAPQAPRRYYRLRWP